MSAALALGAAGAFLAPTGMASIGWLVGVTIANYLFAPKPPDVVNEGTRLGDLRVTSAAYGRDIARVSSNYRISGNIIYAQPLNEVKHVTVDEGSGKGGGGASPDVVDITYTYDGTWAVAFCEGEIAGFRRIWFDTVLVYDANDTANSLLINGGNADFYVGNGTQTPNWVIQAEYPNSPAFRHLAYIVFNGIQLEKHGNRIPNVTAEVIGLGNVVTGSGSQMPLSDVIEELCVRAGLDTTDCDFTAADSIIVGGYVALNSADTRTDIENILAAYNFVLFEQGFTLKLKDLSQGPITVIPLEDLGANAQEYIEFTRKQEIDLLNKVTVKYANADANYENGSQFAMRIDSLAVNEALKELPLVLTDDQAKQLAESILARNWTERTNYSFKLTYDYLDLEVGDLVQLPVYNRVARITSIRLSPEGQFDINAVDTNLEAFVSDATGSDTSEGGDKSSIIPPDAGSTVFDVLDIPALTNNQITETGVYACAYGASTTWAGANIYLNDSVLSQLCSIVGRTYQYTNVTTLSSAPSHRWDRVNSVVIDSTDYIPTSSTEADVIAGAVNYVLVGNELIQYVDATEISPDRYELSILLRGRRGTEHHINTHVADERVIFLGANMEFNNRPISTANYTALTFYKYEEDLEDPITLYNSGNNVRPFSVDSLRVKTQSNFEIDITWRRRSRYINGNLQSLPVVDISESYTVEIYNGITLLRTETVTSSTMFTYDLTMQTADSVVNGTPITFKVYQNGIVNGTSVEITSEDLT